MSSDFIYRPYEELNAHYLAEEKLARLNTPWTSIEAEIPDEMSAIVTKLCQAINDRATQGLEADLSDFLAIFEDHYIGYLNPRHVPLEPSQCSKTNQRIRLAATNSPREWMDHYTPSVSHRTEMAAGWNLDINEILESSRIAGTNEFDAISAYRSIMRWAFLLVTTYSEERARLYDFLSTALGQNEEEFFQGVRYFVRQYHHVTSTSFDCLIPAIENMAFARELVTHLALEEKGHGAFTADSLKALGVREPALLPLGAYAVAIMEYLKLSAHLNPLAFACLFNLFELTGEQKEDPIAALISKSSKPGAARGLATHFKLNQDGAHFTNGIHIVKNMMAVDEYTVVEAARFAELHFMLIAGNCREVIEYGRANQNLA